MNNKNKMTKTRVIESRSLEARSKYGPYCICTTHICFIFYLYPLCVTF